MDRDEQTGVLGLLVALENPRVLLLINCRCSESYLISGVDDHDAVEPMQKSKWGGVTIGIYYGKYWLNIKTKS